jgi:hypothetical protein
VAGSCGLGNKFSGSIKYWTFLHSLRKYKVGPILLSERMLRKDYNRKCSVGKIKSLCRESQSSCRQDELIGGKPPVVK